MSDSRKILEDRLAVAEANLEELNQELGTAMRTIYANPLAAFEKMAKDFRTNGADHFQKRFGKDPSVYGATRGTFTGGDWPKPGSRVLRNLADKAAEGLPDKVMATAKAAQKVEDLKNALDGVSPREPRQRDRALERGGRGD